MTKTEAAKIAAAAPLTDKGTAWGERLWAAGLPDHTVSVHAETEEDARAAVAAYLVAEGE